MKRVTILALHLWYGGTEKAICAVANSLSKKYDVTIATTYKLSEFPAFTLTPKIHVKYLTTNIKPNRYEIYTAIKKVKLITLIREGFKAIKILYLKKKTMINYLKSCDSDVIISSRALYSNWLGKYAKKNVMKIGWEHNYHNNNKPYIHKVVKSTKNLDYLVLVSNGLKEFYSKHCKCPCINIANSIEELPQEISDLTPMKCISIGRLYKEKGYTDLIDIFKIVSEKHPEWTLEIIGDGKEKEDLINKIHKYNLESKVFISGYKNKEYISKQLLSSSIYLSTSKLESFGIAVVEAFSFGLPVIAFSRAKGLTEIIDNDIDGYLIDNNDNNNFADKVISIIENVDKRKAMGKNASIEAQNYTMDKIEKKWFEIIDEKKFQI